MNQKPLTDTDSLLKEMSVELYEEELKRKKIFLEFRVARLVFIGNALALLVLFIFFSTISAFPSILFAVGLVFTLSYFVYSSMSKINFAKKFKYSIVKKLIGHRYPELEYLPEAMFGETLVMKANRYKSYDLIDIQKAQDYLKGYIDGVNIQIMEIRIVDGLSKSADIRQEPISSANVFKGIVMVMDFYVKDQNKLQNIFNSSHVQPALKALYQFWGSYPQVSVTEDGYCIIDISLVGGRHFLEVPDKEKIYSREYFEHLNNQLELLLVIPSLVKQELALRP